MTERGTTGAGRPQITGVPRVHRILELDGCGTMRGNIRFGYHGICPLTSPATIHGSPVMNGAKLSHHWMKSRLGGRLACSTSAEARPKNRLSTGAGNSRRDQMSLRQQLRRRKLSSTSHRKMTGSRRCRELVLCKREFLRIKNSLGPKGRPPRKMRLPTMSGRSSSTRSRTFQVQDVDDWVIGKTIILAWSE